MEAASVKSTLFKNVSWSVASEAAFKLLSFFFFIVFSRRLGETALGEYTYLFAVVAIVNLFWDLGVNMHYNRKWVTEDSSYREDIKTVLGLRVLLVLVSFLVFVPYLLIAEKGLLLNFIFVSVIYILDLAKSIPAIYFLAKNQFHKVFVINIVERIISYGGSISAVLLGYGVRGVILCFLVGKIVSLVVANFYRFSLYVPNFRLEPIWKVLKLSAPLFLVSLFSALYFRIDSVMLKHLQNFQTLGMYSSAYRILEVGGVITGIISASVFPVLVALHGGSKELLNSLFSKNIKYLTATSIFLVISLIAERREVMLFLYGPNFLNAAHLFVLLAPCLVFIFLNSLLTGQMLAAHEEKYLLKIMSGLTLLNIGLNFYLIPTFGAIGAAASTLLCEIVSTWLLYKKTKISVSFSFIPGLAVAAFTAVLAYYALHAYWMVEGVIVCAVYIVCLYFLKVINVRDFRLDL